MIYTLVNRLIIVSLSRTKLFNVYTIYAEEISVFQCLSTLSYFWCEMFVHVVGERWREIGYDPLSFNKKIFLF